jgi:hypothetical protein
MRKFLYCFVGLGLAIPALARNPAIYTSPNAPWTTGPLINASPHVTPAGKADIEPYYLFYVYNGVYDLHWKNKHVPTFWTSDFELSATIGLTKWMDFAINPGALYNSCRNRNTFLLDDLVVGFDFQLVNEDHDGWIPALKLGILENFPIGKFDHFDPKKFKTDYAGEGSYQSRIFLCAGRLVNLSGEHWMNLRLTVGCWFPSRVRVHGLNAYGGAEDTDGFVYPEQQYDVDFSYEFTLNRNWAIACDHIFVYQTSVKFKGYPGRLETGQLAQMSQSWAAVFQMAPAIEYNWSENLGIITGAYFSLAGRNANAFASWVVAMNMVF